MNYEKIYNVVYVSHDDNGMYVETKTFKTKENAEQCFENYIENELGDSDTHFGSILAERYDGNIKKMIVESDMVSDCRESGFINFIDEGENIFVHLQLSETTLRN